MSGRVTRPEESIRRSKMAFRDLVGEAVSGMLARPGRTMLTILGTVLGVVAVVAVLGVAKTSGNQISTSIDELKATSVTVTGALQAASAHWRRRMRVPRRVHRSPVVGLPSTRSSRSANRIDTRSAVLRCMRRILR